MNRILATCLVIVGVALGCSAQAQDKPAKDNKEEVLYKGKPASFWISQLKDRDASFRLEAVKALREIGTDGEGVAVALMKTFADKEKEVRDAARSAFDSLPVEGRVTALVQVVRGKEKALRPAAIDLLGGIGTRARDAVPDLSKALEDEDAAVRSGAAKALGKIGTPEKSAVAALVKVLDDKETAVRLEAARALGVVGKESEPAITSLQGKLAEQKEEDPSTRLELVKALVKIGKENDSVLAAFIVACNDPDESVRKEARAAVASVDVKRRVPTCVQALKATDTKTRLVALQLLAEVGEPAKGAIPSVVEVLKSDDETLRIQAVTVLSKVGPDAKSAVPALIALMTDKVPQVRQEAAKALKAVPIGDKLPALVAALKDKNSEIRAYAVGELEQVGPDAKAAVPALVPLLQEKAVRASAIKALGKIGPDAREAIPSLGKLLDDEDGAIREAALAALRNLGPEAKVPVLLHSLKSEDLLTRMDAARALVQITPADKSAIAAVVTALVNSVDQFERDHALARASSGDQVLRVERAIGQAWEVTRSLRVVGKEAAPALIEVLKNRKSRKSSPLAIDLAAFTLTEIGLPDAKDALPHLVDLLRDADCRHSAALALGRIGGPQAKEVVPVFVEFLAADHRYKCENVLYGTWHYQLPYHPDHRIQEAIKAEESPIVKMLRQEAATALGRIGKDAVPSLVEIVNGKSDLRPYAALALGNLGADAKAAAPALVTLLKDEKCRREAAFALGQIGGPEAKPAVPALVGLLDDPDELVQATVATALKNLGKDAVPALIEMLDGKGKLLAAGALGEIGPDAKEALPRLIRLHKEDEYREPAALAIGNIGGPDAKVAIPTLVGMLEKYRLEGNDRQMALAAATALGKVGKEAVPNLVEFLKGHGVIEYKNEAKKSPAPPRGKKKEREGQNSIEDKYALAAFALGELGPDAKAAIPYLLTLLDDDEKVVQLTAATALGKMGKAAVAPLIEYLKDHQKAKGVESKEGLPVVKADPDGLAVYALGEIGSDAKAAVLREWGVRKESKDSKKVPSEGKEAKEGKEEKPTEGKTVAFLHPRLVKARLWDKLLEADPTYEELEAIAFAKIVGPDAKKFIPVLIGTLGSVKPVGKPTRMVKGKDARREPNLGSVARLLQQGKGIPTEFDDDDLPMQRAAIAALKAIGTEAIPPLMESLKKKRRPLDELRYLSIQGPAKPSLALALASISPKDAQDLELDVDRLNRWLEEAAWAGWITDAELKQLAGFKRLTKLFLRNSPITDEGAKALGSLKNLSELYIGGTQITDAGIAELRKALPNTKIYR